jgi:hypothetical protein
MRNILKDHHCAIFHPRAIIGVISAKIADFGNLPLQLYQNLTVWHFLHQITLIPTPDVLKDKHKSLFKIFYHHHFMPIFGQE